MAFRKVTFNGANVRAADHGALFAGILADGVVSGCDISVAGGVVSITAGYFVAAGRLIENNAVKSFDMASHGPVCRIRLHIDVSEDNTDINNMIQYDDVNDVASLGALTKEDINGGVGTIYDLEIAVINVTTNSIIRKMPQVARPINVLDALPASWTGYDNGIYLIKSSE